MSGCLSLGGDAQALQSSEVQAQAIVQEINDHAHARRLPNPLVSEQPDGPVVVASGRQAANEVRITIGDDARQDGDAEA